MLQLIQSNLALAPKFLSRAPRMYREEQISFYTRLFAIIGFTICVSWIVLDYSFGELIDASELFRICIIEFIGMVLFSLVLIFDRLNWSTFSRVFLVASANLLAFFSSIFEANDFDGNLILIPLMILPSVLFLRAEKKLLISATLTSVILYFVCESNLQFHFVPPLYAGPPVTWFLNVVVTFVLALIFIWAYQRLNQDAEDKLKEEGDEKLRTIVDSNLIGVAIAMNGEKIRFCNEELLKILGYSKEDFQRGLDFRELTAPEDWARTASAIQETLKYGRCSPFEKEYRHKDGHRVPVLVGLTLLDQSTNEIMGFVLDRSLAKLSERQNTLLEKSEQRVRLREEICLLVGHELRIPLRGLNLRMDLLKRTFRERGGDLDEEISEQIASCQEQLRAAYSILDELLDLGQAEKGLKLRVSQFSMRALLDEVVHEIVLTLGNKAPRIRVRMADDFIVEWDRLRTRQVMMNLISNAINYGLSRPVEIRVNRTGPDFNQVRFEVIDLGPGIPQEIHEKIFEKFERHPASEENKSGLGLGLFVCRQVVEAHGGRIWVESDGRTGSTFVFEIAIRPEMSKAYSKAS